MWIGTGETGRVKRWQRMQAVYCLPKPLPVTTKFPFLYALAAVDVPLSLISIDLAFL